MVVLVTVLFRLGGELHRLSVRDHLPLVLQFRVHERKQGFHHGNEHGVIGTVPNERHEAVANDVSQTKLR